jgi:hypothetical protein
MNDWAPLDDDEAIEAYVANLVDEARQKIGLALDDEGIHGARRAVMLANVAAKAERLARDAIATYRNVKASEAAKLLH